MKLVDVTNSYSQLVSSQLDNTDANFVKVYSLGKTNVVFTQAPGHNEIVIVNETRRVRQVEIDFVIEKLIAEENRASINIIRMDELVEISIPAPDFQRSS